jgi:cell division protein FtsZ
MAFEMKEIADYIKEKADPKALIKVGTVENTGKEDKLQVTVIATGFRGKNITEAEIPQSREESKPRDGGFIVLEDWEDMINSGGKRPGASQGFNMDEIINIPAVVRQEKLLQFRKERDERSGTDDRKR